MSNKVIRVQIGDLDRNLFVRTGIDQDRMFELALLYESPEPDKQPPPIVLAADMKQVVDGRHRLAAREYLGKDDIDAIVRADLVRQEDIIAAAYQANCGGAKPPTGDDTEHTIEQLLLMGIGQRRIGILLGLAANVAKAHLRNVLDRQERQKMQVAFEAMRDPKINPEMAAAKAGVSVEKLTAAISGRSPVDKEAAERSKDKLKTAYRGYAASFSQHLDAANEAFRNGQMSEADARSVFRHVKNQLRLASNGFTDKEARFDALVKSRK